MLRIVFAWFGILADSLFVNPTPRSLLLMAGLPLLALGLTLLLFPKKLWLTPLLTVGLALLFGVVSLGKYAFSYNEYSSQFFGLVLPPILLVGLALMALACGVRSVKARK